MAVSDLVQECSYADLRIGGVFFLLHKLGDSVHTPNFPRHRTYIRQEKTIHGPKASA